MSESGDQRTTIPLSVTRADVPAGHPLVAFRALRDAYGSQRTFLLESLGGPETDNRSSMCGLAGRAEIVVRRGLVEVVGERPIADVLTAVLRERGIVEDRDAALALVDDEALWDLPRAVESAIVSEDDEDDLALSFLTFFGYDAARYIEVLPRLIPDSPDGPPDAVFSLVDAIVTLDGDAGRLAVTHSPLWGGEDPATLVGLLEEAAAEPSPSATAPDIPAPRSVQDDITEEEYLERGEACLERIRVGDIYQVQLGHSITVETDADPLVVYERLRVRNPSPYMALLSIAGHTVVCASPELFVRMDGRRAIMRPIAGTASRGGDEDATRARLIADPKERAEHMMLVDLCRNDLGRVARPGTLDVETLMVIETYSHVFHIVSEVVCELADGRDVYDVIRAGFPAGTMSGAPKVRAMEIIESLEKTRRGLYAGTFGLIGIKGRPVVLGLAIRMTVHRASSYVLRASAGFVADSTPSGEWNETLNKLAACYWAVCGREIR